MLRILLWKTGFELAQLKRILSPSADRKIYYFAFGANLAPEVLEQRRIRIYESFDFHLDDAAIRFSLAGFYKDHGYASADAEAGSVVYGKMYLMLERDAIRMDYYEGVPFLKVHEKVFQECDRGRFFYYRAVRAQQGLKPTREYLDYLLNGYREIEGVPEAYIDSMARTEVLDVFEAQDQTGEYVSDINRWPTLLHPLLVRYEWTCLQLVEFLWNRSLLQWLIKP